MTFSISDRPAVAVAPQRGLERVGWNGGGRREMIGFIRAAFSLLSADQTPLWAADG